MTDRAYIINEGRIFRTGTPEELGNDAEVKRVYLGEKLFVGLEFGARGTFPQGSIRMALLQPKLNLKVSQKQILTPGLVQMVSVLALNKLELADMINAELTENPVLEELDDSVPLLDEVSAREEKKERDSSLAAAGAARPKPRQEKDPFEEIDFGSFFTEYLDPGLRTPIEMEDSEKPSFENFLSKPSTLTDHLMWQLGSLHVNEDVYRAAELVIGNLNEEGYLTATDDELLGLAR